MRTKFIGGRTQALAEFNHQQSTYGYRPWQYAYPLIPRMIYQGLISFYWCAWLCVYITYIATGLDLRQLTKDWAYVPALRNAFVASPTWVRKQPGQESPWDFILFFNSHGVAYHIGAIAHRGNGALLYTAEGDTSSPKFPGSESAGGVITTKTRALSDITAAGHYIEIWHNTEMPDGINPGDLPRITLTVDGIAGDATFQRFAQILHASTTENAVRYLQNTLNAKGFKGYDGKPLTVDGQGLYSNVDADTPRTNTCYALQSALGITGDAHDGVFSKGDSHAVELWQAALNAGQIL